MADEFAKGLTILTVGGLIWMVLAGWYRTPDFETQIWAAPPQNPGLYGDLAIVLLNSLFWFVVLGTLTFWVLIPAGREAYGVVQERGE